MDVDIDFVQTFFIFFNFYFLIYFINHSSKFILYFGLGLMLYFDLDINVLSSSISNYWVYFD